MSSPILSLHRASTRFATDTAWGESRHSFSFGTHYDPGNVGFGPLMVHNDERVASGNGYGDHPHSDAEIITWVLEGSLLHRDSTGHRGIVHRGLAQRMSAGSGIVHAERNDAYTVDADRPAAPVHFVQMWVRPDRPGATPSYAQRELDLDETVGQWLPVASGLHPDAAVSLASATSTLWVTTLAPGARRQLPDAPYVHLYVAEGAVEVEGVGRLETGDALRVVDGGGRRLTGGGPTAEVLVWEMGR